PFFFHAEDGIRHPEMSRGLGDLYKRHVELFKNQLTDRLEQKIGLYRQRMERYGLLLQHVSPQNRLNEKKQYAADLMERMRQEMQQKITECRHRMQLHAGSLEGFSPLKKLQQGYSYTELSDGKALRSISQIQQGDLVRIHVTDGTILARTEKTEPVERNGQ
ncbi:MAG: hypothetical protein K2P43_12070, partial [Lachnospiraceae bacterium]|nr:hypothetical protein [Lachnospiraceae bacterium]